MNLYDMTNKMEAGEDHDCKRQQCVIIENSIKNSQKVVIVKVENYQIHIAQYWHSVRNVIDSIFCSLYINSPYSAS